MLNLQLIENQPRWRVAVVARFARLMGVLIHVEGIPFGSNRTRTRQAQEDMDEQAGDSGRPAKWSAELSAQKAQEEKRAQRAKARYAAERGLDPGTLKPPRSVQ